MLRDLVPELLEEAGALLSDSDSLAQALGRELADRHDAVRLCRIPVLRDLHPRK